MKRLCPVLLCALSSLAPALSAITLAPYVWTGLGTGWQGQVTPDLVNGTADLSLQDGVTNVIKLPTQVDIHSVKLTSDGDIELRPEITATSLTLRNGLTVDSSTSFAHLTLGKGITLKLDYAQTFDVGNSGSLSVFGAVTGNANVTFTGSNTANGNNPRLLFANLSGTASTYNGTLTLSASTPNTAPTLVLWNNDSLGSGAVLNFTQGGRLSVHNSLTTLANTLTLNSGGPGTFFVNPQDAPLTLSGTITLANHTTLQANAANAHSDYTFADDVDNFSAPGPRSRQPLVISGSLTETGGARDLHVTGDGVVILSGTTSYTGRTNVGFAHGTTDSSDNMAMNAGGALVFGSAAALPSGSIQSGYYNATLAAQSTQQSNNAGYVGAAASALLAASVDFATFTNAISANSTGAVGLDTLPGETVTPYGGAIDLTHFTTDSNTGIRLGTATQAILTGTLTPQKNTYAFGNGGGVLTLRSALTNNPQTEAARNLNLFSNGGAHLGLILQGSNSYSGGTFVGSGYLVFDGNGTLTNSVPLNGNLTAGGSSSTIGASYIGITDRVATNTLSLLPGAMDSVEFLSRFDKAATWGVLGFDSADKNSPVNIANLNLAGFNDGVFVGTTSAATLSSTITITDDANNTSHASNPNAANTLRLTAGAGGKLTVTAPLGDLGASALTPLKVVVGTPTSEVLSNGTVVFDPRNADQMSVANTYSGGTTVNNMGAITLAAASNNAFGTGNILLQSQGGTVGLSTTAAGLTIPNNIFFATADQNLNQHTATLAPTGANDFTLSGSLSGFGTFQLAAPASGTPRNITLSGDNSSFNGTFALANGTLTLAHNAAAGHGFVELGSDATLALGGNATLLTLFGLKGDRGNIILPDGTGLILNVDTDKFDHDFGGMIAGPNGASTSASLTVTGSNTSSGSQLAYLYGDNRYTGGTSIVGDGAALALGSNTAAGSGLITINVVDGGLVLNTGVTLTNRLQLTTGGLAGFGTFAPTEINGDSTNSRHFTFGANQMVLPGLPDDRDALPGTLTLGHNVVFAPGGTYIWILQDALRSDGYSALQITGNLDLTSLTGTSRFTIAPNSYDSNGNSGSANLTFGDTYQFVIATTTGTILGFDPANFIIDQSKFQNGAVPASEFWLTLNTGQNQLLLNFTAVPEPGTSALLGLGLLTLGLATWRQRRRT